MVPFLRQAGCALPPLNSPSFRVRSQAPPAAYGGYSSPGPYGRGAPQAAPYGAPGAYGAPGGQQVRVLRPCCHRAQRSNHFRAARISSHEDRCSEPCGPVCRRRMAAMRRHPTVGTASLWLRREATRSRRRRRLLRPVRKTNLPRTSERAPAIVVRQANTCFCMPDVGSDARRFFNYPSPLPQLAEGPSGRSSLLRTATSIGTTHRPVRTKTNLFPLPSPPFAEDAKLAWNRRSLGPSFEPWTHVLLVFAGVSQWERPADA